MCQPEAAAPSIEQVRADYSAVARAAENIGENWLEARTRSDNGLVSQILSSLLESKKYIVPKGVGHRLQPTSGSGTWD